jgi:hypothetical protein
MKRNDLVLIAVCVVVSGVLSLVLTNILFGSASRQTTVEVVEAINSDFKQPDPRFFNNDSNNPTQLIEIGNNQVKTGQ